MWPTVIYLSYTVSVKNAGTTPFHHIRTDFSIPPLFLTLTVVFKKNIAQLKSDTLLCGILSSNGINHKWIISTAREVKRKLRVGNQKGYC